MADGTAAPGTASDAFLNTWEQTTTSDVHLFQKAAGPYEKVQLFNFIFLGRNFRSANYVGRVGDASGALIDGEAHTGAGVCAEMRDLLFKAQRDIFKAYSAEVTGLGQTPSESGFKTWCGVTDLVGWQFRGGQHRRGSAIDLDANLNPYIATKTNASFGGEAYDANGMSGSDARLAAAPDGIRPRAVVAYQNAVDLRFGKGTTFSIASFRGEAPAETIGDAYDRFFQLHITLVAYFDLAYQNPDPKKTNLLASDPGAERPFGKDASESGSFLERVETHRVKKFLTNLPSKPAELQQLFDQIKDDYARLRLVMVTGDLTDVGVGKGFAGTRMKLTASRDPARGFLRIRKQIAVILRDHLARWGAIDFGVFASGDIMHFDRGLDASAPVATTPDPNPNNIFYAKR